MKSHIKTRCHVEKHIEQVRKGVKDLKRDTGNTGRYFWPSGHTSTTVAIAASLYSSTGNIYLGILGYSASILMGLSLLDGDFHWTSDILAGALMGQIIGWRVGESFRFSLADTEKISTVEFIPILNPDKLGFVVTHSF
ncbi:MAG: phosphatase PAP2 family protein [Spirochaetia bacterium]|nr:phosphatase PAP2 family protein [Spirochaetia bacterium]